MLIADILHSCSNEGIAEAAVASIGGSLARDMRAEAARSNRTLGALAASFVRSFSSEASERDWRDLRDATRGSEVPLLNGLAVISTAMMARHTATETAADTTRPVSTPSVAPVDASRCLL